jgi:protochlorophyllide reductase
LHLPTITMPKTEFPTVIVTGASSGVGLRAAKSLSDRDWFVVMACRNLPKAAQAAQQTGIAAERHAILELDLGSQASVRAFVARFHALGHPLQVLLINAAVYLPRLKAPQRSPEGYEISFATNPTWATSCSAGCCPTT